MSDRPPEFRPVNQLLGSQPRFGPIPAEQLVPWFMIAFVVFIVTQSLLAVSWIWTIALTFWGCGTWWILTGSHPWRFLSKFVSTPRWTRGRVQYRSLLAYMQQQQTRRTKPTRRKAK